ncbi:MAG: plastocyanin/azurin family copper-binding protein [Anaerolineae bacterium]|nr:plastocyanin/azurin family copper-binding protein [Anaerolineae bacterium]
MMNRILLLMLLFATVLLAGCQAAAPTPMPDVVGVTITMDDIHYDTETIEIDAGDVLVITLINEGALEHDFVIEELPMAGAPHIHEMDEEGGEHEHDEEHTPQAGEPDLHFAAMPGTISTATLTPAEPGRYPFYCSVAGHKEAGMEGVLIVSEP